MSKLMLIKSLFIFGVFIFVFIFSLTPSIYAAEKGYFSTSGGKIIDQKGNIVRIAGVNWGFLIYKPTDYGKLFGSQTANYKDMMTAMKNYGFNTIRLPWRTELLQSGCIFKNNGNHNDELEGLSCLEVMDKIIEQAKVLNLRVILDHHTPSGKGFVKNANWIPAWETLAKRYKGNETVIGADLDNEPYYLTSCWGCGGDKDWKSASQKAGNAILRINPDWLIFVEAILGADSIYDIATTSPITLIKKNKLVYSVHEYGSKSTPESWDSRWGNLVKENKIPVFVGEFDLKFADATGLKWFDDFTKYLKANNIGATAWAWLHDDPKNMAEPWYFQSIINPDYLTLQNDSRQESFEKWYFELEPLSEKTKDFSADANGDGKTNEQDLEIWTNHYLENSVSANDKSRGNFNSDAVVDGLDYYVWHKNYTN